MLAGAIVLAGLYLLTNNKKIEVNKLMFKTSSVNTQFPLWALSISVICALAFTYLPHILSLNTQHLVNIDKDIIAILPAAIVLYSTLILFIFKLTVIYATYPINLFISAIRDFLLRQKISSEINRPHFLKEYNFFGKYLKKSFKTIFEKNQLEQSISNSSRLIFHDIQSPLSTINLIIDKSEIDQRNKIIVQNSIANIKEITSQLLKYDINALSSKRSPQQVNILLQEVIDAKQIEYQDKYVSLIQQPEKINETFIANINPIEFKHALSNLVNNAIEASSRPCKVIVSFEVNPDTCKIQVKDFGSGIPDTILNRLGKERLSSTKTEGSGLGLLSVKRFVDNSNGILHIKTGEGTCISMTLPAASVPTTITSTVYLPETCKAIIIDDDEFFCEHWRSQLAPLIKNENISTFNKLSETIPISKSNFYIIDYNLSGNVKTGLDFIIKSSIAYNSYLCTSEHLNYNILNSCNEHTVRILQKSLLDEVNIVLCKTQTNVVIIDDDKEYLYGLLQAYKNTEIKLLTLHQPEKVEMIVNSFNRDIPIILDFDYRNFPLNGIQLAKRLSEMGFTQLYLSTGFQNMQLDDIPFIKKILSKHYRLKLDDSAVKIIETG